jgi:hypothetical protein
VDSTLITAIGAAVAAIVTSVVALMNTYTRRVNTQDEVDEKRLKDYDEWAPKVMRWKATVTRKWAELTEIKLPDFPELPDPPDPKKPKKVQK